MFRKLFSWWLGTGAFGTMSALILKKFDTTPYFIILITTFSLLYIFSLLWNSAKLYGKLIDLTKNRDDLTKEVKINNDTIDNLENNIQELQQENSKLNLLYETTKSDLDASDVAIKNKDETNYYFIFELFANIQDKNTVLSTLERLSYMPNLDSKFRTQAANFVKIKRNIQVLTEVSEHDEKNRIQTNQNNI